MTHFLFLSSKITVDGDCRQEVRRRLFLGKKAMTDPDSMLKSKDITLPTKVHIVRPTVFPVVMHRYESWTEKKADAFASWCWRGLLRVPWTARRSNQSILNDINS